MITTERLIIRKFQIEDAQAMLEILSDCEVNRFLPWFPTKTLAEASAHLQERYLKHAENPENQSYAICLRADNMPIGYIAISEGESHDLGYGLKKDFWHMGIVTEAAAAVVAEAKGMGKAYITATHDVENPRSGEVMKKLGMTYRYSYEEIVQPKNERVTFKLYQLSFDGSGTYNKYWDSSEVHFIQKV